MRIFLLFVFLIGCTVAGNNHAQNADVIDYTNERELLIEVIEIAEVAEPPKLMFSKLVEKIDRKFSELYRIKDYDPNREDCSFWYGYHQINNYLEENGTHENWSFVLSIVRGDKYLPVGAYCMPPLVEADPVSKS